MSQPSEILDLHVRRLDAGTVYAEDRGRPGAWATGSTAAAAIEELRDVIERREQVRRTHA